MDDITPERLAELVSGDIGSTEAAALRDRIARDPSIAQQLADFEQLAVFLRDEPKATVSAAAIAGAKRQLIAARPGLVERITEQAADAVRTFLASLDFDSRFSPTLSGFRGVSEVVQVAFSAEPCQIDIEILPENDSVISLRGQVDSEATLTPWSLSFVNEAGTIAAGMDAQQDGTFRVSLAPGKYTLIATRGDVRVEAGPLPLP